MSISKTMFPQYVQRFDHILVFDATDTDIQYFTAEVSFKYTIYSITDLIWQSFMIDLDKVQEMWVKDSKLIWTTSTRSLPIFLLFMQNTFELYNTIFLMRKKAEQQKKNIRHERYEYFSGKADPDVYVENPFQKRFATRIQCRKYLDADEKIVYSMFENRLLRYNT